MQDYRSSILQTARRRQKRQSRESGEVVAVSHSSRSFLQARRNRNSPGSLRHAVGPLGFTLWTAAHKKVSCRSPTRLRAVEAKNFPNHRCQSNHGWIWLTVASSLWPCNAATQYAPLTHQGACVCFHSCSTRQMTNYRSQD